MIRWVSAPFLFALLMLVGPLPAPAAPPTAAPSASSPSALTIMQKMKAVMEPAVPSKRTIDVTVRSRGKTAVQWSARQAYDRDGGRGRLLTVLVAPESVQGFAVLAHEGTEGPDDVWMYLPPVRRIRRIVAAGAEQFFLGTDFTLTDLGFVRLSGREFELVGDGAGGSAGEDAGVYVIRETLPAGSPYAKIELGIDRSSFRLLERRYYDPAGSLWRTERFQDYRVVSGVPVAFTVLMENHQEGGSSELKVVDIEEKAEVPPEWFEPEGLAEVAISPRW